MFFRRCSLTKFWMSAGSLATLPLRGLWQAGCVLFFERSNPSSVLDLGFESSDWESKESEAWDGEAGVASAGAGAGAADSGIPACEGSWLASVSGGCRTPWAL